MTSSATLRELANGELNTAIPWRAAYSRSTWFVPMQKQPITSRFLARLRTFWDSLVLDRMPITWTSLIGCIRWVGKVLVTLDARASRSAPVRTAGARAGCPRLAAYLIFLMSSSSGRDVLRASTWYPCSFKISRPVSLTFSSSRILISCVLKGFNCFGAAWRGRVPPQLGGGEWKVVVGEVDKF